MGYQQQGGPAPQRPPERPEERRLCVLFVDPAQPMHQQITQELGGLYEICHALMGGEALDFLTRRLPDLLITEVELPDMSGIALCEYIRAQPETRKLPVLFLTVRAGILEKVAGFQAGADDYLVKPIDPRFFSARIRLLFRIKSLEQQRQAGG